MSDSDSEEDFVTPYGSPSKTDENVDVFSEGTLLQTEQSPRNRTSSCSIENLQRTNGNGNSSAKHRLGSIDISKENLSSAPACASRSMSLDDGVKGQISARYHVNWEGATKQRGVVLVSDGQKEGEVIQQLDVLGINEDLAHREYPRLYPDGGMPPRSPVVIHSATNVIQDSLVYLNQPEKEESSTETKEGKSSSLLCVFRQEDSVFVETNAYHQAEETLENYFRVMLSGQPGDGKSAIAKHLIVKKSRQGYRFVLVNGSNDFDSVNFDGKLILFFDDIFGVTVYDRSRTEDVQRILWQLDSILMNKYGDVLMIMTSRSHILHDALKVLKNADFVRRVTN